jgi:hypothetical protein
VAEILHNIGFAELKDGDILLSAAARDFAELDTQTRKEVFARHLLASVPLAHRCVSGTVVALDPPSMPSSPAGTRMVGQLRELRRKAALCRRAATVPKTI